VFGKNVRLGSGASAGPFCVIEGAEIAKARVGPFARLRPGSEIHDNAKIGNFVEIKNAIVSENSKINHLSYIGDSCIGKNTNIGAGTITCNYDGFKKHRTTIGENVFIGSNSALVAPIQICDNVLIGAGSVITKDVNAGDLALARSKQVNIENGANSFREKTKGNSK
jgi:bifunctional UDP-N-acetylglucosamine pyrophosphorylase/glucosamine-1-phosphate N-acetyltransferase